MRRASYWRARKTSSLERGEARHRWDFWSERGADPLSIRRRCSRAYSDRRAGRVGTRRASLRLSPLARAAKPVIPGVGALIPGSGGLIPGSVGPIPGVGGLIPGSDGTDTREWGAYLLLGVSIFSLAVSISSRHIYVTRVTLNRGDAPIYPTNEGDAPPHPTNEGNVPPAPNERGGRPYLPNERGGRP